MKKLLLTSVIIAAISAGGVAIAKPFGSEMHHHEMRHQQPVKEIVKNLRGLSLSDAQREEIKTLVSAFKNSAGTFEDNKIELPSFDLATATEAQLRTFIQSQLEEREAKHFALAQLRYNIFSVLDDAQQQELLTRQAQRKDGSKRSHDHADSKGLRKGEFHQHGRAHAAQRGPFGDIELSDEQIASLQTLKAAFKTTAKANRETMRNFKDAQRELVLTQTFSQDTWDALLAKYKDELVEAGVAKAKHRQAMFAVLTESQQAEVKAKREEEKQLRGILSAS
ncbi:hypothetical protein KUL42_19740 [Alteromonas sp. KUL42]|uniref:Spy/CpxP family protein refolding chaperone n=1 Tax=Alteromonas sp. KUL42 TaxID=2480797 RepID=UPI0010355E9D|nr:Spy/CpxP family protein refolding chaperone [Alteromonas sp. KUL42]TAP35717.1 hypothetical protein EYR97_09710 [Alteromonas sp. KUL42]GEA07213.1 hypothetical protein KUL42_19740 [Alteromonas sp. KUL42]